jgi:TPR repeat protein
MATVPGTYFTKEQLEADLKGNCYFYFLQAHFKQANEVAFTADKVLDGGYSGSNRMKQIGYVYDVEKKRYDKALAWYILAARENNATAMYNIGFLYFNGFDVPKNYLYALKLQLKAVEQGAHDITTKNIGILFEYGEGVPLHKHKALE